jgi:hypothetical protein
MRVRVQIFLLSVGAMVSFAEVFLASKDSDPGPWAAAILGIVLLRRAIITAEQAVIVILSGCLLAALLVAGKHGFLNVNKPVWLGLIVAAGICYAFWERIEKLWTEGRVRL